MEKVMMAKTSRRKVVHDARMDGSLKSKASGQSSVPIEVVKF